MTLFATEVKQCLNSLKKMKMFFNFNMIWTYMQIMSKLFLVVNQTVQTGSQGRIQNLQDKVSLDKHHEEPKIYVGNNSFQWE